MHAFTDLELKTAKRVTFRHFLRTGRTIDPLELLKKFNENRDPDDGRYTFGPGGSARASSPAAATPKPPKQQAAPQSGKPGKPRAEAVKAPKFTPDPASKGYLSSKYESNKRGPGVVSTGIGDAGGVSYGVYQFNTRDKVAENFVKSDAAASWTERFKDKVAGTKEFSDEWKKIATEEPDAFAEAQTKFATSEYYDRAQKSLVKSSSYDIEAEGLTIQQVVFSTTIQHGPSGGPKIIQEAIDVVDGKLKRDDPKYKAELITQVFAVRKKPFETQKATALTKISEAQKAKDKESEKTWKKSAEVASGALKRFDEERDEALALLAKEGGA